MNRKVKSNIPEMPTVQLGEYKVSKLIIGGNPISGNSHFSEEMSKEMIDYCSEENIHNLLKICEDNGINTWQARGDRHIMRLLHYYRLKGGKINWIAQTASELVDILSNIKELAASGAIAVYHHGSRTDEYWENGQIDKVSEMLKVIRDTGILVGMGSHIPEVFEYAEEKGWDIDFYMAGFYDVNKNKSRSDYRIGTFVDKYSFEDEDRDRMCKFIRQTDKVCLAFKILAAYRKCESEETKRDAFEYALRNIKEKDAVVVGMYLPFQPPENSRYVKEIWNEINRT